MMDEMRVNVLPLDAGASEEGYCCATDWRSSPVRRGKSPASVESNCEASASFPVVVAFSSVGSVKMKPSRAFWFPQKTSWVGAASAEFEKVDEDERRTPLRFFWPCSRRTDARSLRNEPSTTGT